MKGTDNTSFTHVLEQTQPITFVPKKPLPGNSSTAIVLGTREALHFGRPMASGLLWPFFLPTEEHIRIYLLSTETLKTRRLPSGPTRLFEGLAAFSHDGKYLAY
jgi:hypothetical protein